MWINHPGCENPVSLWRWLKYEIGDWMMRRGSELADRALYPERCPTCGAAIPRGHQCDHIPF